MNRIRFYIFFSFFLGHLSLQSQSLTLYAIPSPHPINWKTPHQLVLSIGNNFLVKNKPSLPARPMGHIVVELTRNGDTLLTGMVADKKKGFYSSVFKQQYGLGVLFKLFDGHLENNAILSPEMELRKATGKIAFIRFHINDSSYFYLKNYLDSFRLLGYDKMYNGLNEPRCGEGSGCSAFGVSFLQLINALEPEFEEEWTTTIAIPNRLIGGEFSDRAVSLGNIFFSFRWANDKTPHTHLTIFDPNRIYSWIHKKYREEELGRSGKYGLETAGLAKGLLFDYQVRGNPRLPMFMHTTTITLQKK